ncbi:hypothetical protein H2198_002584 [Neophaeococcomyces mojaviensis]|uniref:Uncharacterized protein n=1 Tax=Neophaeococcomyces mojaviensis TaxID=3383035 RepID=A0ACC3ADY5_9EURO|nr:hypothetical protein H2198_002584 [Knufia sp. JES_112]
MKRANSELDKLIEDTIAKVNQTEKNLVQSQQETEKLLGKITNENDTIQKQKEKLSWRDTTIEEYGSEIKSREKELKALRTLSEESAASLTALPPLATPLRDDQQSQM